MDMNRLQLKNFILQTCSRYIKWSTVAGLGKRFGYLQASLPPIEPELGEPLVRDPNTGELRPPTQPCRLLQHYGFRSQPEQGSEIVVVAPRGGTTNAVAVASDNLGAGRVDLEEGESLIYCKARGTEIFLDKDGQILISRKAQTISAGGLGIPVCTVSGTLIVAGSQLKDPTGQIVVETLANISTNGPPNTVPVALRSVTTGSQANLPAGTILTFVSPPANVGPTLVLTAPLAGALDREASIRINTAGQVTVDAAAGADVVINGGALKVARDTDPVSIGTLSGVADLVTGVVKFVFVPTGVMVPPAPNATVTLSGKIADGAPRFKG